MDLGENVVARVWSFSSELQEIPYIVTRIGYPKKQGGNGVKWNCTCPAFSNRGGHTCKHLIALRNAAKDGTLLTDERFNVSDYGQEVLGVK